MEEPVQSTPDTIRHYRTGHKLDMIGHHPGQPETHGSGLELPCSPRYGVMALWTHWDPLRYGVMALWVFWALCVMALWREAPGADNAAGGKTAYQAKNYYLRPVEDCQFVW